jgi:hypothetical protein
MAAYGVSAKSGSEVMQVHRAPVGEAGGYPEDPHVTGTADEQVAAQGGVYPCPVDLSCRIIPTTTCKAHVEGQQASLAQPRQPLSEADEQQHPRLSTVVAGSGAHQGVLDVDRA